MVISTSISSDSISTRLRSSSTCSLNSKKINYDTSFTDSVSLSPLLGDENVKNYKPPGCRSKWSQANTAERIYWILSTPIRALMCISNILIFFCTYFGFILPILWAKPLWPRFYWFYEGKLYAWLQAFIGYWGYTADYDIYEYGDDITKYCNKDRVLLICNHQSTADVPTLFSILQSKGVAARKAIWLMDVMFKWTPFGIISRIHGDYFIKQGKATREKEVEKLKEHLRKVFWERDRRWVILFPEGGFYYKRVESSQKYGKLNNFPFLKHTTLPRIGAVNAILNEIGPRENNDTMRSSHTSSSRIQLIKDTVGALREKKYIKETRPPITYILDVTIAYPNASPLSLATLLFGTREKCDIAVNYKVYNANEVPFTDEIKLRNWLYDVYKKKDEILDNYYKYGAFNIGEKGHRIVFTWSKIIGMYTFWLIGFIIQINFYPWIIYKFLSLLFGA